MHNAGEKTIPQAWGASGKRVRSNYSMYQTESKRNWPGLVEYVTTSKIGALTCVIMQEKKTQAPLTKVAFYHAPTPLRLAIPP